MPDTPDTLSDAIRRAEQHRHEALEKPDDLGLYNFLFNFVIKGMKEGGHDER